MRCQKQIKIITIQHHQLQTISTITTTTYTPTSNIKKQNINYNTILNAFKIINCHLAVRERERMKSDKNHIRL